MSFYWIKKNTFLRQLGEGTDGLPSWGNLQPPLLGTCKVAATIPVCSEERGDIGESSEILLVSLPSEGDRCRSSFPGTKQAGEAADMPCCCCYQSAFCWKRSTSGVAGSRPAHGVWATFASLTGRERPLGDSVKLCCSREDHKA